MNNNTNRWYILPGMGATSLMYDSLRAELHFEIRFLDWPKYDGEKTYAAIAGRVVEENDIEDGDIVGGSSLGGMVAIEIARQRKLKAVVLIGSATSASEVQGLLAFLAPVAALPPISLIQFLLGQNDNIIAKMFADADPEFIKEMCRFLPKWPGIPDLSVPVFRIHGQKDHVIPCPRTGCEIIADAGHLLPITHARECGEYLNRLHRKLTGASVLSGQLLRRRKNRNTSRFSSGKDENLTNHWTKSTID